MSAAQRIFINSVLSAVADLVDPNPVVRQGAQQRLTLALQRLEESFGSPPPPPPEPATGWAAASEEASIAAWHARSAVQALGDRPAFPVAGSADARAAGGVLRSLSSIGASAHAVAVRLYGAADELSGDRRVRRGVTAVRERVRTALHPAERLQHVFGDTAVLVDSTDPDGPRGAP